MNPSSRCAKPPRHKWLCFFVTLAVLAHLTFLTFLGLAAYRYKPPYWGKDISQAESATRWSERFPVLEEEMHRYGVKYHEIIAKEEPFKRELEGMYSSGSVNMRFENHNGLEKWSLTMTVRSDHFIGNSPEDQAPVEMAAALYSTLGGDAYSTDFIEEELARLLLIIHQEFVPMESGATPEPLGEAETYFGPFFAGEMFIRVRQQRPNLYITRFNITACTRHK